MKYFIDLRQGLVREDEINLTYLAPELYYEYTENTSNIFTEKWYIGNDSYLDVSYAMEDIKNEKVQDIRRCMFDKYNTEPIRLCVFYVPSEEYHKTLKHFGYEK